MSQFGTPNYCNTVFRKATQWSSLTTMPDPSPASVVDPMAHATYLGHINAGDMWCNQQAPTNNGIEVNIEVGADDVTHVSPPVVREPVFTCGRGVAVGGFVPGAKLSLQIDRPGGGSYSLSASSGEEDSLVNFDLPQPLEEFDQLTAIQEFGGVASALSQSVIVRDHPGTALPPPTFDGPEIYACADSLSVRATPGSEITVEKNATAPMSTSPGDGWALIGVFSPAPWATPWQPGDQFEVQAKLECVVGGQVRSWVSPKVALAATTPPALLRQPTFDPAQTYAGQRIIGVRAVTFGAFSWLTRTSPTLPLGRTFSAPDGWGANFNVASSPLGRELVVGERISAEPALACAGSPPGVSVTTPPARICDEMPPPQIAAPAIGAVSVVVLEAMPGARIRIFDASNVELADGQGPQLALRRAVVSGDVLRVTQTVGTCSNNLAFQIPVLGQ